MPLIAADAERVASLEKIAQQLADTTGKTISLVHFTHREEIRTIEPNRAYDRGRAVRVGESEVGIPHPPGWEKLFRPFIRINPAVDRESAPRLRRDRSRSF